MKLLIPLLLAGLLSAAAAQAQPAARAQASASATILEPSGVTQLAELSVARTLRPARGVTRPGVAPAIYGVTGARDQVVSVQVPAALHLHGAPGVASLPMTLSAVLTTPPPLGDIAATSATVRLRGHVVVSTDARPGAYAGSYTVIVNFN